MRVTFLLSVVGLGGLLGCGASGTAPEEGKVDKSEPAVAAAPVAAPSVPVGARANAGTDESAAPSASGPTNLQDLQLMIPEAWTRQTPSSSMRLAQYELPGSAGGATMAVFRFPGGGGSAAANLARWKGQLAPHADSRPAKEQIQTFGPITVTSLDAVGKFAPGPMPGAPAVAPIERGRMLAAVVEGVGDAYFFKCTGPEATLTEHEAGWAAMLASVTPAAAKRAGPPESAPAPAPAP